MTPDDNQESKDDLRDSLKQRMGDDGPPSGGDEAQPRPASQTLVPQDAKKQPKDLWGVLNMNLSMSGPGIAQMTAFCRQLATLIDVGIPLVQSLTILAQRVEHPRLKKTVAKVARSVEEGESFSKALEAHPSTFSSLVVNVVRIGEHAGILEGSLKYLADLMERRYELRRKVKAALAYPTAALIVCGLVIIIILKFAIPVFAGVYEDADVDLPDLTRNVLAVSGFVSTFWWLIILLVGAAVFQIRYLIKSSAGFRKAWDLMCLKVPIAGSLAVKVNVTRTTRTMSNLLSAGIPLLEALMITAETSENTVVAEMIKNTHDNLEKGGRLEGPMREARIFPPLVIDMIAIGDEAGRLDIMFDKVAETYDSDVNQSIATLNAVIEPALIIIMGGIVAVLALAVLLPYWKISDAIAGNG